MNTTLLLFVVLAAHLPQQEGQEITFHVTSVEQGEATDFCATGQCSATRFTVGGFTTEHDASVEYVLECVEVIVTEPKPHLTSQCVHVHSHQEYGAKLYSEAISFDTEPSKHSGSDEPLLSAYTIKSEKEVRKK